MGHNWKKWIGWAAAAAGALAVAAAVVLYESSLYESMGFQMQMHVWCDGFFVSAVVFLGIGALVWISELGGFGAMGYLFYMTASIFSPRKKRFEERKSYYDFLREKEEKRTQKHPASRIWLITGGADMLLATLFLILFTRAA